MLNFQQVIILYMGGAATAVACPIQKNCEKRIIFTNRLQQPRLVGFGGQPFSADAARPSGAIF